LFHPAHFIGVAIMLAIFAAWAVPFLQVAGQGRGLTKWSAQFSGRASPVHYNLLGTLSTLGRAIGQLLPWVIFVPLLRFGRFKDDSERAVIKALVWSVALPLILVSLAPVSAPRYSLPAIVPF